MSRLLDLLADLIEAVGAIVLLLSLAVRFVGGWAAGSGA